MAPKLYSITASPPVRAVLITARAINLELDIINVNLFEGEHLKPEYLKLNPQHTVPTLDDDGFVLWDSHAIISYLVEKYGKDDSLYPKEPKARALVNQRLFFDASCIFARLLPISKPIVFEGVKTIPDDKKAALEEAYGYIEKYLESTKFVAGNQLTIADLSLITTVTSCDILVPVDAKKYPKVIAWVKEIEKLPYYDANKEGLESFRSIFKSKLGI